MAIFIATRCLDCGLESSFEQREVVVGPIRDQLVTGSEEVEGISNLHVEQLYKGKILNIDCPYCVLRISIAADLAPWTLGEYLLNPDSRSKDLDLKSLFHLGPIQSHL